MKTKIAVVIFSVLVLGAVGLLMLMEERDFRLVALAPTATRTPTKTPRLTRTLVPTLTPQSQPTRTPSPPTATPMPTAPPISQPTMAVSTAFTPPPLSPTAAAPPPTARPTTRPQPKPTAKPTPTMAPLIQFVGNDDDKSLWLSTYSPNCGSMGIGKRFSKVIDAQGKPVAGVVIKLWWPDANPDEYIYSNPTGNDGAFEISLGVPRDFTAYVTVHSHWGNLAESSDVLTIHFQGANGKDCLTPADGGTGLGHQWAVVVFKKL
ncbi:MAG: hypothetical protein KKA73_01350, partial [Chloroflexi bacterium]|nr:hypothetical protein [Chloroflexota bacterium]